MSKCDTDSVRHLYRAILNLKTEEECMNFFEDLCTVREILNLAQRLDTAVMLKDGAAYNEISERIGISTATISRVNNCLKYGNGGYMLALERMEEKIG